MIRVMDGLPDDVVGFEAVGKVTEEDYEQILAPAVEEMIAAHGKVRCIYVLGEEFEGWTFGAMWEDAKVGGSELRKWEKIALVTDTDWVRHAVKGLGWMIPGDVKVYPVAELADAKAWVSS
jgi:hypothetical protein